MHNINIYMYVNTAIVKLFTSKNIYFTLQKGLCLTRKCSYISLRHPFDIEKTINTTKELYMH